MNFTCSKCKKSETVSYVKTREYPDKTRKTPFRTIIYKNAKGQLLYGNICRECYNIRNRKLRGTTSRDDSKKPYVVKAVNTEKLAAEKFKQLGFSVERTQFHGPDLVCTIGALTWTVEVKPVSLFARSWRVSSVKEKRKNDDLIALVLPNGRVYIDSMKHHLSKCGKMGTRSATAIVKEFGLNPLPKA